MLFKPELAEKILKGQKTQTRRLCAPDDCLFTVTDNIGSHRAIVVDSKGRKRYETKRTYAICPGRGKPQIGRICITAIREEEVCMINGADARAEGFADQRAFINAFKAINPKSDLEDKVWVLTFELVR